MVSCCSKQVCVVVRGGEAPDVRMHVAIAVAVVVYLRRSLRRVMRARGACRFHMAEGTCGVFGLECVAL